MLGRLGVAAQKIDQIDTIRLEVRECGRATPISCRQAALLFLHFHQTPARRLAFLMVFLPQLLRSAGLPSDAPYCQVEGAPTVAARPRCCFPPGDCLLGNFPPPAVIAVCRLPSDAPSTAR